MAYYLKNWGGGDGHNYIETYPIYEKEKLLELDFDRVYVAALTEESINSILNDLKELRIPSKKIYLQFAYTAIYARINFIRTQAKFLKNKKGAVAELGVYKGESAQIINESFPNDNFYLFDTFEGFDKKDIDIEKYSAFSSENPKERFSDTSIDVVKNKMKYPNNCYFIKGYFPDSLKNINNDLVYKFVNIDCDLYQPIYNALEYFYPRLIKNGIILIHDYFNRNFKGASIAVDKFSNQENINFISLGDGVSVFFIK